MSIVLNNNRRLQIWQNKITNHIRYPPVVSFLTQVVQRTRLTYSYHNPIITHEYHIPHTFNKNMTPKYENRPSLN